MTAAPFPDVRARWATSPLRVRDLVVGMALAVLALGLGWLCLPLAMAHQLIDSSPSAALGWRPNDADALADAAQDRLDGARTPADLNAAADLARRSLRRGALGVEPLQVLGFIAQRQGRMDQARLLMNAAGARSHRESLTQAWLFDDGLDRRDYPAALDRADALLRLDEGFDKTIYPALADAVSDPAAVGPLVGRLAERPDWRTDFLASLSTTADPGVAFRVFAALKRTATPPNDVETGFLVGRLIGDEDYVRAYRTWAALLPTAGAARLGGLVYDGNFAAAPGAPPFNWRLSTALGVVAERAQPPSGPPIHALHVRFLPSAPTRFATEILLLPPGGYRLAGQAMVDEPIEDGQFVWSVVCVDDTDQPLAEVRPNGQPDQWHGFSADFRVPQDCPAQQLQLIGRAGDSFDEVGAWYADMAIQRTDGAGPAGGGGR